MTDDTARTGRAAVLDRWRRSPMLLRHLAAALAAFLGIVLLTSVTDPFTNLRIATIGYHLVAVAGLALLIGVSGQISLGHGAFMFIGAYTMALLVIHVPGSPLWANLLLAIAASCAAGVAVGAATARLHGPYLAGATLILAVGLPAVALRYPEALGGSNGLTFSVAGTPPALSDTVPDPRWQSWVVWLAVLLALVVVANVSRGRLGRRLRAVRDDEAAAALSGLRPGRLRTVAFVISAGCGGLAGALQAYLLGTATPSSFGLALSLSLLAAVVLGGLGSLWGALWGALALVYVEVWGHDAAEALGLSDHVANNLPIALFGAALIAIVLLWPSGVQGGLARLGAAVRTRRIGPGGRPD
ncbi:branched-chain amino acid ABC transporter permease [Allonocardiopsis opalescens]|uniref:Amino acid/amide ABC transporter membrane protein 2 (HAAT family) n=1 Tax=Allonocardiopsis opalescens TaxID=1144618 RepID=A0A2T0Q0S8_9ACTN|nr:branched-chain amino acid ABC transporter permease [Allonocardiopsis opalescens]PRX97402.1 amino acid/amide ABC transporter membrane protein 2 (HAAT family) [Allonocardiopsis opalescens]